MKRYPLTLILFFMLGLIGCATPRPQVEFSTPPPMALHFPDELEADPSGSGGKVVALVGIENKSIYAADKLWDIASHLLTTRLVEIGYFSVVDWERMKAQFDIGRLKSAGLVSTPESLRHVRERLACDYFLGGAITYYDVSQSAHVSAISKSKTMTTTVRIDLWLQDARTGEYLSAASGNGRAKQQFSGGLLGGNIGTWDINVANKSLNLAINDGLVKLIKSYHARRNHYLAKRSSVRPQAPTYPEPSSENRGLIPGRSSGFNRVDSKWAIIIGIGRYMDPRINSLEYTARDADAAYQYLVDPRYGRFSPDQVFLLKDERATTFNIKLAIDTVSKHAKPKDTVVIFISSHGTPGRMDVAGVGYLATYDTLVDSLYATAFNMSDLVTAVNERIKAKTIVTLADACYSAGAFSDVKFLTVKGAKDLVIDGGHDSVSREMVKGAMNARAFGIPVSTVRELSSGSGRIFISSSRADERSWESDDLKHGFFTYYLIEALKRKGGNVSIQEAYRYIGEKIPEAVMREKGKPQHPVMGVSRDVKGDILIGAAPEI